MCDVVMASSMPPSLETSPFGTSLASSHCSSQQQQQQQQEQQQQREGLRGLLASESSSLEWERERMEERD